MSSRVVTIILYLVLIILLINVYNIIENKAVFSLLIVGIVGINVYTLLKFKSMGVATTFKELKIEFMLYGFLAVIVVFLHFATENKIDTIEIAQGETEIIKDTIEEIETEERKNAILKIENIVINCYPFDTTTLTQNQKSKLDTIADILIHYPDIKVLIIGHTCEVGTENINLKKGLKRAEAGKEYLMEKGIASERILVETKGEKQPLVPDISCENRKQNRRITFVIE